MKLEYQLSKALTRNPLFGKYCLFPGMTKLLLVGVTGFILVPILLPAVKKLGKSIAKETIKGGIIAYEGSQELISEAKAEIAAKTST
ncbi:hypothetical protein Nos7524_5060 [Nostoc sp. PCC 7524]|uniref:hypothetical protein n=1 Tax=Nostoc sp. (strain ATCC 29411 / PCC 7524) TaxID=28072 RepID=UPI00029F068D|nr:hypothetical protein [Nostoc sp. PCC 7524]AFY50785.1 hypothetical protein Nos7524_5060 [Nostoc sp. PCC 7524]